MFRPKAAAAGLCALSMLGLLAWPIGASAQMMESKTYEATITNLTSKQVFSVPVLMAMGDDKTMSGGETAMEDGDKSNMSGDKSAMQSGDKGEMMGDEKSMEGNDKSMMGNDKSMMGNDTMPNVPKAGAGFQEGSDTMQKPSDSMQKPGDAMMNSNLPKTGAGDTPWLLVLGAAGALALAGLALRRA